jgi:multidrug resistance efflux pump
MKSALLAVCAFLNACANTNEAHLHAIEATLVAVHADVDASQAALASAKALTDLSQSILTKSVINSEEAANHAQTALDSCDLERDRFWHSGIIQRGPSRP